MAPVLDSVNGDITQITGLLGTAELVNIRKIAAGVDNVDIAILADDSVRLRHIMARRECRDWAA